MTLLISSNLNVSPRFCASLLQAALAARSRWPSRSPVEIALILYHRERWALTESWKQIVEGAIKLPRDQSASRRKLGLKLSQALQALLALKVSDPKTHRDVSLPTRLLSELDFLREQAVAIEAALRNPPTNPAQRLPDEIQLDRLAAVRQERRAWGHVLYLLCISEMLSGDEMLAIAQWLSRVKEDDQYDQREHLMPYVLAALLSGLETSAKASIEGTIEPGFPDLLQDRATLSKLNATINATTWSTPSLQAVVQLQWCLLLVQVVQADPSIGGELRVTEESVSQAVLRAIQNGDALVYTVVRLLGWKQHLQDALQGVEDDDALSKVAEPSRGFLTGSEDEVDPEFQQYLQEALHGLLLGVSRTFLPLLRRIQRQEEDAAYTPTRSGASPRRRFDLEAFLDSISLIVLGDAHKALDYWLAKDGRRTRFLLWAVELREDGHQRALLDLLSALASGGGESAWQAHALLSTSQEDASDEGLISWTRLWDWIGYYIEALRRPLSNTREQASIPPREIALLKSFLGLLKGVVASSYPAREALLAASLTSTTTGQQNQNPFGLPSSPAQASTGTTVVRRLFAFYTCPIPTELKASTLDVLAAFARDPPVGSGSSGGASQVRQELWTLLEGSGVLGLPKSAPARQQTTGGLSHGFGLKPFAQPQQPQSGVLFELHNVEAPSGLYPGTISFINFVASLIVPDAGSLSGRASGNINALVADLPSTSSSGQFVQQNQAQPLGAAPAAGTAAASQASPTIGLEKYLSFVTDAAFLPSVAAGTTRDFASPGEKWRLVAACLAFYQRCLDAFDLSSLERFIGSTGRRGADDRDTLLRLAMHPGFGVMKRLMDTSKLLRETLRVLTPQLDLNTPVPSTVPGFEILETPSAKRTVFIPVAVRNAMRLVLRAMKGQDLFLQVLLPTLAAMVEGDGISKPSTIFPAGLDLEARIGQNASYTSIDAKLLQEYDSVIQIALFVNSSRDDLALLSVHLLSAIAASSAFSEVDRFSDGIGGVGRRKLNRLVGLLEMTDESGRLREGLVRRLDALAESNDSERMISLHLLSEDEEEGDKLMQGTASLHAGGNEAICRALLDLLLSNIQPSRAAPNIAHLILGFDLRAVKAEDQVIYQSGADNPRGALHAILDLLRGERGSQADEDLDGIAGRVSLLQSHPALGEKALALLVSLATHSFTSSSVLRYLRSQEDFWASELRDNFDSYIEPVDRESWEESAEEESFTRLSTGSVVYPDGRSIPTSVDALVASLYSRTHLLNGVALELHGLVSAGHIAQAAKLTIALFGAAFVVPVGSSTMGIGSQDRDFIIADQTSTMRQDSGIRLLEMLRSFDFEWHDDRDGIAAQLSILSALDIQQARNANLDSGAREFDVNKTIALLASARRELERQGELNECRKRAAFDHEAAVVLQYISCRNAHRAIAAARRAALVSWRSVHDLVMSHSSVLFRPEGRATVVFDCLGALLPRLEGPQPDEDPILADLSAGAVLTLLTSLRRHRAALISATNLTGALSLADDLPADRLIHSLRALTNALLRTGMSVSARGHLYSALINFLQLARAAPLDEETPAESQQQQFSTIDDTLSLAGTNDFNDGASGYLSLSGSAAEIKGTGQTSILEQRTRSHLVGQAERLVPIIARDALDAPAVWRTVAFTLLDKLVSCETLTRGQTSRSGVLLDVLNRGGFMKSFVARLRDMDLELQEALRPDPSSLNALYVYEAQLAFFARLAQSSQGADRLLEAKIFEVFAQADYLAARPEQDQDFVDLESFLPAATERYGALLRPALQVSVSIVNASASQKKRAAVIGYGNAQRGDSHTPHTSLQQALALINAHRDSFLAVLRSSLEDATSISTLEQAQLIVTLLLQIFPILDDDALNPPKPLAMLHSAVLALAAGFLHSTTWKNRVVPFTEAEREMEATEATSAKIGSKLDNAGMDADGEYESQFDAAALRAVSHLNVCVLSYLEAASEMYGQTGDQRDVRPCLTSTLAVPQPFLSNRGGSGAGEDLTTSRRSVAPNSSGRLASVASLGMALASLDEQVALLEADLQQADHIKGMLESSENVRLEEWDTVARQALSASTATSPMGDLGLGQRKAIAVRALKTAVNKTKSRSTERLDVIDLTLVLIYRHFSFYLSLASANAASFSQSIDNFAAPWRASSTFGNESATRRGFLSGGAGNTGNIDADALLRDGSQMVQLVLERLGRVLMTINSAPGSISAGMSSARERTAFLELVGRKLQTLLMVRGEEATEQ